MRAAVRRSSLALGLGAAALGLAGLAVPVYRSFQADLGEARRKLTDRARWIETPLGAIEYADEGVGPPVLSIHGAGGGFDQGLFNFREAVPGGGYRVIAPSRFGYLGSPAPNDASPELQADYFAALLDELAVDRVAVVAHSAGALSALQLAIRHPHRVSCLILVVPGTWAPPLPDEKPVGTLLANPIVKYVAMKSDFALWAFMKLAPTALIEFLGVPRHLQEHLSEAQRSSIEELMRSILPVGPRLEGIELEGRFYQQLEPYPLERIRAPTLIVDAEDVSTFRGSEYTASQIPGARFVRFHEGGHLLAGHEGQLRGAVSDFLRKHRPTAGLHAVPRPI
jgi:2-hydroxy-6-oxonona-2,4-dienedioate hydrolase